MADDLGSKNVIEALLAQQNNPNKLAVVNYALGYFSNKGISHLAKRTSHQLYMIQRRTTVDGNETIQDVAVASKAEWMAEHTNFSEQVQFDKDKDTMVRALKLMMGSEFDEVFKPVKQDDGTFLYPEEDLLPCEIWEECKKRLKDQHFDSGTNLKTELSLVLYHTGEDFMEFKGKFLDLTTQIKYQDPDDLPDTESIPTLLNSVVGWVDPSHPMHGTCQRISDDLDKMKKARRRNPNGRIKTKVTLASALDRLQKKTNESTGLNGIQHCMQGPLLTTLTAWIFKCT